MLPERARGMRALGEGLVAAGGARAFVAAARGSALRFCGRLQPWTGLLLSAHLH